MTLSSCLQSAVNQGAITGVEAEALLRRHQELRGQLALELGDAAAAGAARDRLARELKLEAIEDRRLIGLTRQARDRALADVTGYRDARGRPDVLSGTLRLLEHFGFSGYSSVEGRMKSIVGLAHARMADLLDTFDRSLATGARRNKATLAEVVRELHGEDTKNLAAKGFASTFRDVAEDLRGRFNAAGGQIGHLDGWALPQLHDPRAMVRAGRGQWKKFIAPRLDLARMRDPLTGDPLTAARLQSALDVAYDRIVSDGWGDRAPQALPQGRGALAGQRSDHRFLIFRDAAAWQDYASSFGQGDAFAAMMNHVRGMARDVAAMEILGPNPGAMVEWLKQVVRIEQGKATAGQPSLYQANTAERAFQAGGAVDYQVDALWNEIRSVGQVNAFWAAGFANVRSLLTSALLGSASVTAIATDPFIANAAKRLSGLPTRTIVEEIVRTLAGGSRRDMVRSGLILDDAMHVLGQEARYVGTLQGTNATNWLADRTLTLSGLAPWTQARKFIFGRELQGWVAENAGSEWSKLDARLRRTMEGYGFDAGVWNTVRGVTPHEPTPGALFVRPADVALTDRAAAERYLEMILGETERAVPSGTKRLRSLTRAGSRPGTVTGELVSSFMQFKGFVLSLGSLQLEAVARETADFGKVRGARYAGALLLGLTLGGAVSTQIKQLLNGKDPQPMDDPRFWVAAAKAGGGLGLFGDFLFADQSRFGQDAITSMAGPTFGLVSDVTKATLGNVYRPLKGDDVNSGDVTKLARYTPVISSLWYTRLAWQRAFIDQLDYLADPDAHRTFRTRERRLARETGQEFWWRPGELVPQRAP